MIDDGACDRWADEGTGLLNSAVLASRKPRMKNRCTHHKAREQSSSNARQPSSSVYVGSHCVGIRL